MTHATALESEVLRASPVSRFEFANTALTLPLDFSHRAPRLVLMDALRGVAILLIVFGHVVFRMPENTLAYPLLFVVRRMGVIGVDCFVVLSGYFTAGYLFAEHHRTGRIALRSFFARRVFKILPPYLLCVLAMFAWQFGRVYHGGVADRITHSFNDTWIYFAFLQNYYEPRVDYFVQTWTLALLIQFYIGFTLIVVLLAKIGGRSPNPFRLLAWLFPILIPVCFLLRNHAANMQQDYYPWYHNFQTQLRLDELFAGVWLAYMVVYAPRTLRNISRFWPIILIASLAAMIPVAFRAEELPRYLWVCGYSLSGFGCMGLTLLAWAAGPTGRGPTVRRTYRPQHFRPLRWLAAIGVCSYSIFIWHQPFGPWLGTKVGDRICNVLHLWGSPLQYWVLTAAYYTAALGGSLVMYFLVERTSMRWRNQSAL